MRRTGVNGRRVSVPSFGDSFFILMEYHWKNTKTFVSVPSFGDSFFILSGKTAFRQNEIDGFRPLIRGFFFYFKPSIVHRGKVPEGFPSPHSGILFL